MGLLTKGPRTTALAVRRNHRADRVFVDENGYSRCEFPATCLAAHNRFSRHRCRLLFGPVADVLALLHRDHDELERALTELGIADRSERELRDTLDAIRVGLAAHAEGEGLMMRAMLSNAHPPALVYLLCSQVIAAHLAQEGALAALEQARPGSRAWRERAAHLKNLIDHHDEHESACVLPALRDYLPSDVYNTLAGSYASARLRALGTVPMKIVSDDELA